MLCLSLLAVRSVDSGRLAIDDKSSQAHLKLPEADYEQDVEYRGVLEEADKESGRLLLMPQARRDVSGSMHGCLGA